MLNRLKYSLKFGFGLIAMPIVLLLSFNLYGQTPLVSADFIITNGQIVNAAQCDEIVVSIALETTGLITNAEVYLEFNPIDLEVLSIEQPISSPFDLIVLAPQFDNITGTISFAAGITGGVSNPGSYEFLNIAFRVLGESGQTMVSHILSGFPSSRIVSVELLDDVFVSTDVLSEAQNVVVNLSPDIDPPSIVAPADLIVNTNPGECIASEVVLGIPAVDDNCGILIVAHDGPLVFPVGSTTITWSTLDFAGNSAGATQQITIVDNEVPSINCALDATRMVDQYSSFYQVINDEFDPVFFSDNCSSSIDIQIYHNASSLSGVTPGLESDNTSLHNWNFPIGLTSVIFYATDDSGNENSCAIDILVIEQPSYADFIITSDNPVNAATCDEFLVTFSVATTGPITNAEIQLSFLPPQLEVVSVEVPGGSPFNLTAVFPDFDNINGTISYAAGVPGGLVLPGVYPFINVWFKAMNDNGVANVDHVLFGFPSSRINTLILQNGVFVSQDVLSSAESLSVNLSPDITNPSIMPPADIILQADSGACLASGFNLGLADTDDNCGIASIVNDAAIELPVGVNEITWTVTDLAGNIANANQFVTVVDIQAPNIQCALNGSRAANQLDNTYSVGGNEFDPMGVTDNCTITAEILVTHNAADLLGVIPGLGANSNSLNNWQFPQGVWIVTFSASDFYGNVATCEVEISVSDIVVVITTNISGGCAPLFARLRVYDHGTTDLVETFYSELDALGNTVFEISTLAHGNYDLFLKIERFLQKGAYDIDFVGTTLNLSLAAFFAGDISGLPDVFNDNIINSLDLSLLLGSYNTTPINPLYNARCDLNCNDVIDALDLSLLLTKYFTIGEAPS